MLYTILTCISCFILLFLLMSYYLLFILYLFYFIFFFLYLFQTTEMMLANSSKFFISIQNGSQQQRQLAISTTHLAQELLTNVWYSGVSRSFAKEMRALNMRSIVASHLKLTTTNSESSLRLILLQLHKLPKNSTLTIL